MNPANGSGKLSWVPKNEYVFHKHEGAVGAFERENSFRPGLQAEECMEGAENLRGSMVTSGEQQKEARFEEAEDGMSGSPAAAQWAVDEPLEDSGQGNDSPLWFLVFGLGVLVLGRKLVALYC